MLKKSLAVFLAVFTAFCCLLPAAALTETGRISLKLNSDIAGCTEKDVDRLVWIGSDNVVLRKRTNSPVSISDYAGTMQLGEVKAGRTYYIDYDLEAADGYVLPEKLSDLDVEIECGKGVTVISAKLVSAQIRNDDGEFEEYRGVHIYARVLVDGNALQRIIGFFIDVILKIKAWSLY